MSERSGPGFTAKISFWPQFLAEPLGGHDPLAPPPPLNRPWRTDGRTDDTVAILHKKPVKRARKTARCVIYHFPQSTGLFVTARTLLCNPEFPIWYGNLDNHQNGICTDTGISRPNENLHKNLENPANAINTIPPETIPCNFLLLTVWVYLCYF